MIKIEKQEITGWTSAVRGMRNPMNSWNKADSFIVPGDMIGESDHDLMMRLMKAGTEHAKYRRMLVVYTDITAPLYWWKEFDTYKIGTVANSCSTMHKITSKRFVLEDFSCEHLLDTDCDEEDSFDLIDTDGNFFAKCSPKDYMLLNCMVLNYYRRKYIETKDKKYWWQLIQLLPSSYNQKRTIMLNYEVLANIYRQRRNHKLDEWHDFCDWIESLPYSELITGNNI